MRRSLKVVLATSGWIALCALWSIGAAPFAFWTMLAVSAVRAWRYTGDWPRYGYPDSHELPAGFHQSVADPLAGLAVLAIVAAGGIALTRNLSWQRRLAATLLASVALWGGAYGLIALDPGDIVDWAMD